LKRLPTIQDFKRHKFRNCHPRESSSIPWKLYNSNPF
jgi:hypothetical protein